MKKWKSVLQNLSLIFVFTLITIVVCEFAVRQLLPQETLFPRYIDSAEYPIEFPENSRLVNAQGNRWEFIYNTNELGRRGPYHSSADNYDTTNVVVLGDSFTFGIGVNDEETYTQTMSEQLGREYAVINGGMGGWGIDSEIKWFYKVGASYKPKYVVLQFTMNDVFARYSGITRIEKGEFKFYPYRVKRPAWQLFVSNSSLLQNSHLYVLFRTAYDHLQTLSAPADKGNKGSKDHIDEKKSRTNKAQLYYVKFLDLFATELNKQGIELIFISVTHMAKASQEYRYDLDKFSIIKQAVKRLENTGALHYAQFPLEKMQTLPGSPEGHQWGSAHHELVGRATANTIVKLEK